MAEPDEPIYASVAGVSRLVDKGAKRCLEGVRQHVRMATLAREIARVILDMRIRFENAEGLPDLESRSTAAKAAAHDMYAAAGREFAKDAVDPEESVPALAALMRSVQHQMRQHVLPEYVASLATKPAEARRFAALTAGRKDVVEVVADHYGIRLPQAIARTSAAPEDRVVDVIARTEESIARATERAARLTPQGKAVVRAEIDKAISSLRQMRSTL